MKIIFGRSGTPCIGKKEANTGRDVHVRGAARASPEKMAAHARRRHPRSCRVENLRLGDVTHRVAPARASVSLGTSPGVAAPRFPVELAAATQKKPSLIWERHVSSCRREYKVFSCERIILFFFIDISCISGLEYSSRLAQSFSDLYLSRERGNFVDTVNAFQSDVSRDMLGS